MVIQIDTREKARAIKKIIRYFMRNQIVYYPCSTYVGDYFSLDNARRVIDRKQNLSELYSNICHEYDPKNPGISRFGNELERAKMIGVKLIFLIEHGEQIKCLEDVKKWKNPQLEKTPFAWCGLKMYHEMIKLKEKYDIEYHFCEKDQTGEKIVELLQNETD